MAERRKLAEALAELRRAERPKARSGNPLVQALSDAFMGAEEPLIRSYDDAALALSPVPVLGDIAGAANDARRWYEGHISPGGEEWGAADYGLAALGLAPAIPPAAAWGKYVSSRVSDAKRAAAENRQTARVARKIADPSLDMSDAARMARADELGYRVSAYHGTPNEFTTREFNKTADLGYHFGTAKAAEDRLQHTIGRKGGHIGEFRLRAENPLDLPDLEAWSVKDVVGQARKRGALTEAEANALLNNPNVEHGDIVNALKAKGYDSIRYRNRFEDPGSNSWIVFDPDQIRHIDAGFDPAKRTSGDILSSLNHPVYG